MTRLSTITRVNLSSQVQGILTQIDAVLERDYSDEDKLKYLQPVLAGVISRMKKLIGKE
jgi:hypothetical protein